MGLQERKAEENGAAVEKNETWRLRGYSLNFEEEKRLCRRRENLGRRGNIPTTNISCYLRDTKKSMQTFDSNKAP